MNWIKKIFNNKTNLPTLRENGVNKSKLIPEPTRSLIFVTDEDPAKSLSPFSIKISIILKKDGVHTETDDGHNIYGEPSLIWKKLPIRKSNQLEEKPIYYPSYSALNPEQRYQYLSWLMDVTQPTNLSYVFLYYYGLERHLLVGGFEKALKEILRLLEFHDEGSFRSYAQNSLIVSILHKERFDLFEKYPFISDGVSNEILLIRKHLSKSLKPEEIMELSSEVGFKNKYYIRKCPSDFLNELNKLLIAYEKENGSVLNCILWDDLEKMESSFFGNFSLPDKVRTIKVPQLINNKIFQSILLSMLEQAHSNLKQKRLKKK